MTYKYIYIRRAIYEENPASELNTYRNLAEMTLLFKLPYWIMLIALIFALVFSTIIIIVNYKGPLMWIPFTIIILVSIISQIPREKYFYKDQARKNELSKRKQNYEDYVIKIRSILCKYGIDTPEKLEKLKEECTSILKKHEEKFNKVNSKIFDMLVGVPLGALIASIIYANNDAIPDAIVVIILIGFAILGLIRLIGIIQYYSEGYFKDKYLLDAINELDYC